MEMTGPRIIHNPVKHAILRIAGSVNCARNGRQVRLPSAAVLPPHWYRGTLVPILNRGIMPKPPKQIEIERIQTGVRIERRLLKVLKALAEYKNMTLGDLLEGIVLHAFEGKPPFTAETLRKIGELKGIYDLDLDASASHRLKEKS